MRYFRMKDLPIRKRILSLDHVPDNFGSIDFKEGLNGSLTAQYIEQVTDYIEEPFPIVSDVLFKTLKMYQNDIASRYVSINYSGEKHTYWAFQPKIIDCVSIEHSFDLAKSDSLILRKSPIKYVHVFLIKGLATSNLVVSLPVAESLLRKNMNGFKLVPIETVEE